MVLIKRSAVNLEEMHHKRAMPTALARLSGMADMEQIATR
jgi:hypothetical protein